MTEPVGQSVADVLGLLRAVRSGETDMLTRAVTELTVDELWQSFIVALALLSTLADAMDQQRSAAGLEPVADRFLEDLARSLKAEQPRRPLARRAERRPEVGPSWQHRPRWADLTPVPWRSQVGSSG